MNKDISKKRIIAYKCQFFPKFKSYRKNRSLYRWLAVLWGWAGFHNIYYMQYKLGFTKFFLALILLLTGGVPLLFILWIWGFFEILFIKHEKLNACTGKNGESLLHEVIRNRADLPGEVVLEMVNVLIKKNIDVNLRQNDGFTALHYLVQNRGSLEDGYSIKIMKCLMNSGSDILSRSNAKEGALQMILKNEGERSSVGVEKLVETLLDGYKKLPPQDKKAKDLFYHLPLKQGDSPLWILLHNDGCLNSLVRVHILDMLVENGVDVDELDNEQTSPLQFLCQGRAGLTNEACIKMKNIFISAGADVKRRDKRGNSILHLAALNNQIKLCSALLANGGDRFSKDANNKKPGDVAPNAVIKNILSNVSN